MSKLCFLILQFLLALSSCLSSPSKPALRHRVRQSSNTSLVVDLGYGVYQGYYNATSQLNIFKGIRYAAPPVGALRWQKPKEPEVNRAEITQATEFPPRCPQSPDAPMSATYDFTKSSLGSEDCLFLSVWTPSNATNLPVMVWIHGGGYGLGGGNDDFSDLIVTNSRNLLVVAIQYRLGAFGFLSSSDLVANGGVPNAGLYDMNFALQWVQSHIRAFGGDPNRVTISGISAGAGAVMLQAMAYNGAQGTSLFKNGILASPYLPMQYDYNGLKPEAIYRQFVSRAGCGNVTRSGNVTASGNVNGSAFKCLVEKDTVTLQNASAYVSANTDYGEWAFLPVTDGEFVVHRPSEQLLAGNLNGLRMLSGNNANEGPGFTPQTINTTAAFDSYIKSLFPLMDDMTLEEVKQTYAIPPTTPGHRFSTLGNSGPSALNQSVYAIGQQQRANNLYAETTFVCPSYWLASAFSPSLNSSKEAWKYEFSVPPALHADDQNAFLSVGSAEYSASGNGPLTAEFRTAFQLIWGRFVIYDDPTLPPDVIASIVNLKNGTQTSDNMTAAGTGVWPQWQVNRDAGYKMLRLNMTGGHEVNQTFTSADGKTTFNVSHGAGPGLTADFALVDAYDWEAGRGQRCEFWAHIGKSVPERDVVPSWKKS